MREIEHEEAVAAHELGVTLWFVTGGVHDPAEEYSKEEPPPNYTNIKWYVSDEDHPAIVCARVLLKK